MYAARYGYRRQIRVALSFLQTGERFFGLFGRPWRRSFAARPAGVKKILYCSLAAMRAACLLGNAGAPLDKPPLVPGVASVSRRTSLVLLNEAACVLD